MNFLTIAQTRQSCRRYDSSRPVEHEKLVAVLEAARLAPTACNAQSFHITVCTGDTARQVAAATVSDTGMNRFAAEAPVLLVISELPRCKNVELATQLKGNDCLPYDIGIISAYITAEAAAQGLGSCILGWLDDAKIREICQLEHAARLVITLGYALPDDPLRDKKRKPLNELVTYC